MESLFSNFYAESAEGKSKRENTKRNFSNDGGNDMEA